MPSAQKRASANIAVPCSLMPTRRPPPVVGFEVASSSGRPVSARPRRWWRGWCGLRRGASRRIATRLCACGPLPWRAATSNAARPRRARISLCSEREVSRRRIFDARPGGTSKASGRMRRRSGPIWFTVTWQPVVPPRGQTTMTRPSRKRPLRSTRAVTLCGPLIFGRWAAAADRAPAGRAGTADSRDSPGSRDNRDSPGSPGSRGSRDSPVGSRRAGAWARGWRARVGRRRAAHEQGRSGSPPVAADVPSASLHDRPLRSSQQ